MTFFEALKSHSACQRISCFLYGTRGLIIVFTKARHRNLFWTRRIAFAPSIPICLRSIFMLSSHLRIGLPRRLLLSGLPTKTPLTPLHSDACYMSHPPHPPWLNHLTILGEEYRLWNSSLCNFLHDPSSFLFQISSTLCSQKLSLYVPPSKWETKFRTHTAQPAKLQFCIF
jgi:hypothetical protein